MPRKSSELIEVQRELSRNVRLAPLKKPVRFIAGADVSSNFRGDTLYAGIVVLSYPELRVLEEATAEFDTRFPYIPGFLSFRELPALLRCLKKLSTKPDVFMVDGQGIAHPRGLGIASHLGVETGIPAIGVAKSVLYGVSEGDRLLHPKSCRVIGSVLKTKERSNPLIISPGHLITLDESVRLVRETLRGYRLPEPTRLAHKLTNDFRLKQSNTKIHGSRNSKQSGQR